MNCAEAREYVFAFLDNELDAPLSIELQRHLDSCASCARETEIELTVRKQLGKAMAKLAGESPPLKEAIQEIIEDKSGDSISLKTASSKGINHQRWRLSAAALIVIYVGISASFIVHNLRSSRKPGQLAELVVRDFEHFIEEGEQVELASHDALTVSDWLRRKTAIAVVLPKLASMNCKLLGGRKCKIAGRPAAFAAYDIGGAPASLVAMRADDLSLAGMEPVSDQGFTYWVDRCRGHTVVAHRRDDIVYTAVSKLSKDQLQCLITGAWHESD